eukprot:1011148_1
MLVHHGLDIDAVMRPHEKVEARTGTVGRKAESTEAFVLSDDALRVEEPMAEVSREAEVNLLNGLTDYLDRLAADKHENSQNIQGCNHRPSPSRFYRVNSDADARTMRVF